MLQTSGAAWRAQTPHLKSLSPRPRGKAWKTNATGPTIGGHYRIALKSYSRFTAGSAKMH